MSRPLVLAGPILRRVELNRVVVWIALRDAASVRLKVWPGLHEASSSSFGEISGTDSAPTREVTTTTMRFGAGLHVALADLKLGDLGEPSPTNGDPAPLIQPVLDPGAVYSYNINITPESGADTDLRAQDLLAVRPADPTTSPQRPAGLPLGYATNQLPSFATCPSAVTDLKLLQVSCRRGTPGAPNDGEKPEFGADDLMAAFDPLIGAQLGDPLGRPHQLFLTGDQIYADDTAGPILPSLTRLAHDLLATDELIPLDGGLTAPLTEQNYPAGSRQKLVTNSAAFTSSGAANHVIGLGEYYASYLVAWSEACWDTLATELPAVDASQVRDKLTDWEGCIQRFEAEEQAATTDDDRRAAKERKDAAKKSFDKAKKGFKRELKQLEGYRRNIPLVRRILANVPTYMIFDDHDVTDDWNLTQEWRNRVLTTNLGNTIVRNALVAYAVFQGWGNDPGAWERSPEGTPDNPNHELLVNAAALFATPTIDTAARDKIDTLIGSAGSAVKVKWHYRIEGSAHRVVVLDTRNHRQLSGRHRPPGLIAKDKLGSQLPGGPLPPSFELLVVVSPAPVMGPAASDHVIQPLGAVAVDAMNALSFNPDADPCSGQRRDPFGGNAKVDLECWFANDDAVEALLQRLATYGDAPIVVLSGDVHYGLSAVLDYWKAKGSDGDFAQTRIVQFTSSAARNVWPSEMQHLLAFTRQFVPGHHALLQLKAPLERLAWADNDPRPIAGAENAPRPLRTRLRRNPVLVPADGWPDDAAEQRLPDWAWRVELIADLRSDDPDGESPRPDQVRPPPPPEFDASDPLAGYAAAVARHGGAVAHKVQLRSIVAEFNVGAVSFTRGPDGGLVARSDLYSRNYKHSPQPLGAAPNTTHVVPLTPTADPRPEIGGADG